MTISRTKSITSAVFWLAIRNVSACGVLEPNVGILGSHDFSMACPLDFKAASQLDMHSEAASHGEVWCEETSHTSQNYGVQTAPGKGLGVFATQRIPAGSHIIVEAPLITIQMPEMVDGQGFRIADMITDIEAEFQTLDLDQQTAFLSLHDFRFPSEDVPGNEQNRLLTIFRSNAYNTGEDKIGLFPKIARINHSCRPNAGNHWSEKERKRKIYAMRDIENGEEITVSYIPLLKSTKERQARLQQYGFTCSCPACHSSGEGDKKRKRISESFEDLEGKVGKKSEREETNKKRVEKAMRLVGMVQGEGLMDYSARAYHLAAVFNSHAGKIEEAERWARREKEVLAWVERDSEELRGIGD